jgi:galactose mutarotase-like enzyme
MPAVMLTAGATSAGFRPGTGMLCTSLKHGDDQFVAWPRTLADFKQGLVTAVPLVHPWGNRLSRWGYRAAGEDVDLEGHDLPVDANGLPIHGNLRGAKFAVIDRTSTHLQAVLDYGARPELLRDFPFPHLLRVDATLTEGSLRLDTTVVPTSDRAVPISFCWHPYLRMPEGARKEWQLRWPACDHVEVDDHIIPTGARTHQDEQDQPIARRTFDDHYALGADRRFEVRAAGRTLTLTFDEHYPYGQLYVPPKGRFIAIEPMTATIAALDADRAPLCQPGDEFTASFTITVAA